MNKIFIIEDNEDHAFLIRRSIEDSSSSIFCFAEGAQALKACDDIKRNDERPDLIFLDLKLPGMDGFEVLSNLRKIRMFERVPVVMLTTSCRKEEIEKAYQMGANGFVVKSDHFEELSQKLKMVKQYWFSTVEPPYTKALYSERAL